MSPRPSMPAAQAPGWGTWGHTEGELVEIKTEQWVTQQPTKEDCKVWEWTFMPPAPRGSRSVWHQPIPPLQTPGPTDLCGSPTWYAGLYMADTDSHTGFGLLWVVVRP